jgi:hypothetical protein
MCGRKGDKLTAVLGKCRNVEFRIFNLAGVL